MMRFTKRMFYVVVAFGALLTVVFTPLYAAWWPFRNSDKPLTLSGNIEAHESVLSFSNVQSRIIDLPFDEGKTVRAGTMLAKVDDSVYRQQLSIAGTAVEVQQRQRAAAAETLVAARKTVISDEADLAQKQLNYDRSLTLWKQHFVDTAARDETDTALKQSAAALARDRAMVNVAERNLELAEAGTRNAQQNLKMAGIVEDYTILAAPFDGVLLVRQAELGEVVSPGTPIFTLADLDHVWLRAYLNETYLGRVRLGQAVTLTTDSYPDKKYVGRISFISSSAEFTPKSVETHEERVTLVYRLRIDVDNRSHELLPGMPADAQIKLLPPG